MINNYYQEQKYKFKLSKIIIKIIIYELYRILMDMWLYSYGHMDCIVYIDGYGSFMAPLLSFSSCGAYGSCGAYI